MTRKDIPNYISFARILLTIPIVWLLLTQNYQLALWLFFVAGVSDALDGFLAKRFGWASELGAKLDPAADKLLLTSSFLTLGWTGVIPAWLVVLVVLRDIIIVGGWIAYNHWIEHIQAQPMMISKINTFLQILLVLVAVVMLVAKIWMSIWFDILVWLTALTTIASGVSYVSYWGKRAVSDK